MQKKTNVQLDHNHELGMYEMLERGMRGCMCQVSKQHREYHSKWTAHYSTDIVSGYILHLDVNNLYGGGMTDKLLYADVEWSDDIQTDEEVLNYESWLRVTCRCR